MKAKKLNGNTVLLIITIALFFVMYAVGCVIYSNKGFTHLQTFLNILINNAGLLCITCGMTCVMLTGGICYCLNTMSGNVQQALGLEMDAIASSVIGGTLLTGGVGNVIGSFFGVLINGTISTLVKTNGKLLSSWSNIAVAALLCFFIVLQSIFAKIKEKSK